MPELQQASSPHRAHPAPPWRDSAIVAAVTLASLLLSAHWQLAEKIYAVTRRWEWLQVDELSVGLLVLAMGLIWLSWRRNLLVRRELRARAAAEAALASALGDNRRLAQEHVRIQEAERKHLARELHDQLGQYLNAIKLDAVSIAEAAGTDAVATRRVARCVIRSVDHVYGTVGDMIGRLRPVGLDELGLSAAIEHCVGQWRARLPATSFTLCISGCLEDLSEPLALTVYRLVQEGLTNIHRHADARSVAVGVTRRRSDAQDAGSPCVPNAVDDILLVTVEDDGRGMHPQQRTAGFGLQGMRERVQMAGGSLTLSAAPGHGLVLTARLPLPAVEPSPSAAQLPERAA